MNCISNFLCKVYGRAVLDNMISTKMAMALPIQVSSSPYESFKEMVCSPTFTSFFGNITGYKEFQDLTCSIAQKQTTFAAFNEALSSAATCGMKTTAALIDLTACEIQAQAGTIVDSYAGIIGMASLAGAWALDRYEYETGSKVLCTIGAVCSAALLSNVYN